MKTLSIPLLYQSVETRGQTAEEFTGKFWVKYRLVFAANEKNEETRGFIFSGVTELLNLYSTNLLL